MMSLTFFTSTACPSLLVIYTVTLGFIGLLLVSETPFLDPPFKVCTFSLPLDAPFPFSAGFWHALVSWVIWLLWSTELLISPLPIFDFSKYLLKHFLYLWDNYPTWTENSCCSLVSCSYWQKTYSQTGQHCHIPYENYFCSHNKLVLALQLQSLGR